MAKAPAWWLARSDTGSTGQDQLVALGPLLALGLVLTTAITEETLWRGYVVERLAAWISPILAAAAGLAVLAASHVPFFGPAWLITNLPGAVLLDALILWRRNLWACILCHFLNNAPIILVALTSQR